MAEIRALRADEIECRVNQVTASGVMLLLYKDARCDMAVLDETFTHFGWKRSHELINGKEFCTVSVRSDNGEWISKQDCGTESNTEKAKGESSDAFKRACVNWGIGRELYTKIPIFIKMPTAKTSNGKFEMTNKYTKFFVKSIKTDNKAKKILELELSDAGGKTVFKWDNKNPPVYEDSDLGYTPEPATSPPICKNCSKDIRCAEYDGQKYTVEQVVSNTGGICFDCYMKGAK